MALDLHTTVENEILGGNGTNEVTLALPPGTKLGDILIMVAVAGCEDGVGVDGFTGHTEIATPADWQLFSQESLAYPGGSSVDAGMFMAVFWRAIESEPAPVDVTLNTGLDNSAWSVSIIRCSNVAAPDNSNPSISIGTAAAPSVVTTPSVTVSEDDSLLIYCLGALGQDEADFVTEPVGMTHVCHMFAQQNSVSPGTAIFVEGVDAGASGTRQSSVNEDGVGRYQFSRPMAFMLTLTANGGVCADGRTFFIGTDKIFTA